MLRSRPPDAAGRGPRRGPTRTPPARPRRSARDARRPRRCHFEARRPDGTLLGGTIWHRSEYQVGIRLHGANELLLIIDHNPTPLRTSNGRVTAVLSTFGTDDEAFATIGQHWVRWWGFRRSRAGARI